MKYHMVKRIDETGAHARYEDGTNTPTLNQSVGPQVAPVKKEERQLRKDETDERL